MKFYFLQEAIAGALVLLIFVPIAIIVFLLAIFYIIKTVEKINTLKSIAEMENKKADISNQVFVLVMLILLILFIIIVAAKFSTITYS